MCFFLGIFIFFIKIENTCDPVVGTKDIMQLREIKTYEMIVVNAECEYAVSHLWSFQVQLEIKKLKISSMQEVASKEMDMKFW